MSCRLDTQDSGMDFFVSLFQVIQSSYLLELAEFCPSENGMKMCQEIFAPFHPISTL